MSDSDKDDDFKIDERGIFQDKFSDYNGLKFDERGIMCNDAVSFYHGGNDSGFCTAEQKSSSSLIHQCSGEDRMNRDDLHPGSEEEEDVVDSEELDDHFGNEDQSYHISDHILSCSVSIEGSQEALYHLDADDGGSDSHYPELVRGYLTSESEISRQEHNSLNRAGDQMTFYRTKDPYYPFNDDSEFLESEKLVEFDCHSQISGSSRSSADNWKDESSNFLKQNNLQTQAQSNLDTERQKKRHTERVKPSAWSKKETHSINRNHPTTEANVRESEISNINHLDEENLSQGTELSLKEFEELEATLDNISDGSEDLSESSSSRDQTSSNFLRIEDYKHRDLKDDGMTITDREPQVTNAGSEESERSVRRLRTDKWEEEERRQSNGSGAVNMRSNRTQDTGSVLWKTSEALAQLRQTTCDDDDEKLRNHESVAKDELISAHCRSSFTDRPEDWQSLSRNGSSAPLYSQKVHSSLHLKHGELVNVNHHSSALEPRNIQRMSNSLRGIKKKHSSIGCLGNGKDSQSVAFACSLYDSESGVDSQPSHNTQLGTLGSMNETFEKSASSRGLNTDVNFTKSTDRKGVPFNGRKGGSGKPVNMTSLKLKPQLKMKRINSGGAGGGGGDDATSRRRHRQRPPLINAASAFMKSSIPDALGRASTAEQGSDELTRFREMFLAEKYRQQIMQEEFTELHRSYTDLLQRHAEARNTLDFLRLRTEVSFSADLPPPIQAQTCTLPPANHASSFTVSKIATASLGVIQQNPDLFTTGNVLKPQKSHVSEQFLGVEDNTASSLPIRKLPNHDLDDQRLCDWKFINNGSSKRLQNQSLEGGGMQSLVVMTDSTGNKSLSLLTGIKILESQISEFRRSEDGQLVSVEEKKQFLKKIKDDYAGIEHLFDNEIEKKTERHLTISESEKNEIGSRLVQLHLGIQQLRDEMKIPVNSSYGSLLHNDVDDDSEEDISEHLSPLPFEKQFDDTSDQRKMLLCDASVVSLPGNCNLEEDILQDYDAMYSELMDSYRKLKQIQSLPQNDDSITKTLAELKKVYLQLPGDRKRPLPLELENSYNSAQISFCDSNMEYRTNMEKNVDVIGPLQDSSASAGTSSVMSESELTNESKQVKPSFEQNSLTPSHDSISSQLSEMSKRSSHSSRTPQQTDTWANCSIISRDKSHSSRRLPKTAVTSSSHQTDSVRDELSRRQLHSLNAKQTAISQSLSKNCDQRTSSQRWKPEHKIIRTSAQTPPNQLYSESNSDATTDDGTVEEIFKPQARTSLQVKSESSDVLHHQGRGTEVQMSSAGSECRDSDDEIDAVASDRSSEKSKSKRKLIVTQNVSGSNNLHQSMALHPEYLQKFQSVSHQALEPVFAQVPPGILLTGRNGYMMGTLEPQSGLLNMVMTDNAKQLSFHHINQTLLKPHNSVTRSQSHSPRDKPLFQEKDGSCSRRDYERSLRHQRLQCHDTRDSHLAGGDPLPSVYFEPTICEQQFLSSVSLDRINGEQFVPGMVPTYETQHLSAAADGIFTTTAAFVSNSDLPNSYLETACNVPTMSVVEMQYMNGDAANTPYENSMAPSQGAWTEYQPIPFGRFSHSENNQPLVVTGDVCPLCGKPDYHTHSGAETLPQHAGNVNHHGFKKAVLSNPVSPLSLGLSHGIAHNAEGGNYQQTASTTAAVISLEQVPLHLQSVPAPLPFSSCKVQYFVHESSGDGKKKIRFYSLNPNNESPEHHLAAHNDVNNTAEYNAYDDGDDDYDADDCDNDTYWSLTKVLIIARSLRKLSKEMKSSFQNELLLSF